MGRARRALRYQLAIWHVVGEPADSATLLLSELATNAVNAQPTNDGRDLRVRFELSGARLRLEVYDTSGAQPTRRQAADDDVCGRGLALVEALADGWGVEPRGGAEKVVWALLVVSKEEGPS